VTRKANSTRKPPHERPVINPLPQDYQPFPSRRYPVQDLDTWENIAMRNHLDVDDLIYFNFHTNIPEEVNWYLRRNVGCIVPSPSGWNWTFEGAQPGIIYLPLTPADLKPRKKKKRGTITSPFALEFDGPGSPLNTIGKFFDGFTVLDMGLAIFGVEFGGAAMLVVGSLSAPFAPFVAMGAAHEAAIAEIKGKLMKRGLALGIVLAADGRTLTWIKQHNGYDAYFKTQAVKDINYPNYGNEFKNVYNTSFAAGLGHGSQFTDEASKNLFKFCIAQMSSYSRSDFQGDSKNWSDKKWELYYTLCAAALEQKITLK
jgi:hypothetical protein